MRRFAPLIPALFCLLAFPAATQDLKEIEKQLETAYRDKVLTIRGFYGGNWLRYDADGNLLDGGKPGPWTLSGKIEVTDIKLNDDKLEVLANRLWLAYEQKKKEFRHLRTKDRVLIELPLPTVDVSHVSVVRGLERVFLLDGELATAVPDHWKSFLSKDRPLQPVQPGEPAQLNPGGLGVPVYRVGGSVSAPICVSCPQPEYTSAARALKKGGLLVLWSTIDEQGRVQDVQVREPLGLGLDDAAVETVKKWRFKPATRFGEPVPVALAVEVRFHPY